MQIPRGSFPQNCTLTTVYEGSERKADLARGRPEVSFKQEMRKRDHFCSVDGNVKRKNGLRIKNQAKEEHRVDALAPYAEEGRG